MAESCRRAQHFQATSHAYAANKMWRIVTDVARSVVCLLMTRICPANKTAEPIEMPFEGRRHRDFSLLCTFAPGSKCSTWKTFVHKTVSSPADSGGPKESRIRWGRYSPTGRAILGVVRPTEKHWESNEQFRRLHTESAMMWWVTKKMKNGCCFTLGERDNPFLI